MNLETGKGDRPTERHIVPLHWPIEPLLGYYGTAPTIGEGFQKKIRGKVWSFTKPPRTPPCGAASQGPWGQNENPEMLSFGRL